MPNVFKDFEEYRIEVRVLRTQQKWYEAIKLCEEYLKATQNNGECMEYWFIYHNMSLLNKKIGNIYNAIKFSIKALEYVENDNWHKYEQTYSLWLLADCYKIKGENTKATHIYKHLLSLYRSLKAYKQRMCILYNWAELRKDTKSIQKLIKIYKSDWFKKCLKEENINSYNELDDSLYDMYNGLIKLYKENDEYGKIFSLIGEVDNKIIKQTLIKQITA